MLVFAILIIALFLLGLYSGCVAWGPQFIQRFDRLALIFFLAIVYAAIETEFPPMAFALSSMLLAASTGTLVGTLFSKYQ